jgi:hypothetical protein
MEQDCPSIWASFLDPQPNVPPPDLPFPPNDFWFNVNQEDDEGKFTGTHLKTLGRLIGTCILDPNHAIEFYRYEGQQVFRYYGTIERDPLTGILIARGVRSRFRSQGHEFNRDGDD